MELPVNIRVEHVKQKRMELYYPIVYGLPNKEAEQKINYEIAAVMRKLIADQGFYQNPQTEVTGTFELKANERGVLSLTMINYAYSGGAHGMTIVKGLTFDVATGKKYSLRELFLPNKDYVKPLSDLVAKQIKERDIFLLDPPFKGISPNQDFYIADKVLVLFYQLYDLTPYAYGLPHFPISVYEIQPLINEQSPLGKMI
ncbi:DUF3298 and DUF4163 domain-containing protein [Anoxybacteroides tepidamans]|uniref:DUF3298 and DUF4163 domain-containing protein n=1 Tax=Anoxybacteroides tepidamans TaxID=265948 RepID=UPI0005502BB8|nr:DUF3298 and DUF4163 domain-containing protein [Anoxybacillus tepidamans]